MKKLVKTIKSTITEGEFDVNDHTLWQIESEYRKAEDKIKELIPFPNHPDFPNGEEYSVRRNTMPDDIYENWKAKLKYELKEIGFVEVKNGENRTELHTPTHTVYYNYGNQQIFVFQNI